MIASAFTPLSGFGRMARSLRAIAPSALLVALLAGVLGAGCREASDPLEAPPLEGDVQTIEWVVENETSRLLPRADLWLDVPRRTSAEQTRSGIDVSHPYVLQSTGGGNDRIHIEWLDVPVSLRETVTLRAGLSAPEANGDSVAPDSENYLRPISSAEARDGEAWLRLAGATPDETVTQVLAWASALAEPTDPSPDADLAEDLASIEPDAGRIVPMSALTPAWRATAALRAASIPARVVVGFAAPLDGGLDAAAFEEWVEVYLGGRWQTRRLSAHDETAAPTGVPTDVRMVAMRVLVDPDESLQIDTADAFAERVGLRARIR